MPDMSTPCIFFPGCCCSFEGEECGDDDGLDAVDRCIAECPKDRDPSTCPYPWCPAMRFEEDE